MQIYGMTNLLNDGRSHSVTHWISRFTYLNRVHAVMGAYHGVVADL